MMRSRPGLRLASPGAQRQGECPRLAPKAPGGAFGLPLLPSPPNPAREAGRQTTSQKRGIALLLRLADLSAGVELVDGLGVKRRAFLPLRARGGSAVKIRPLLALLGAFDRAMSGLLLAFRGLGPFGMPILVSLGGGGVLGRQLIRNRDLRGLGRRSGNDGGGGLPIQRTILQVGAGSGGERGESDGSESESGEVFD